MKRWWQAAGLGVLALFFVACSEVALHHNLTEAEADRVLVLLDKNGITAHKEKSQEGQEISWTVTVKDADTATARRLLVENNLPHRQELGLSGVYKEKGLIPTPDEQRARFLLALKGEVINALRTLPGVHDVGVVINVPETKDIPIGDMKTTRPSASVVLRVDREQLGTELTEEKIKRFVSNAIPEMLPQDVIVIMSAAGPAPIAELPPLPAPTLVPDPTKTESIVNATAPEDAANTESVTAASPDLVQLAGITIEADSLKRFRVYLVIFLIVLILISSALLFVLFRFSRARKNGQTGLVPVSGPGELLEMNQGVDVGPRDNF